MLPPPSHYTTQVTFLFLRKVLKLAGSSRAVLCQPSPEGLCDLNLGAPLARDETLKFPESQTQRQGCCFKARFLGLESTASGFAAIQWLYWCFFL